MIEKEVRGASGITDVRPEAGAIAGAREETGGFAWKFAMFRGASYWIELVLSTIGMRRSHPELFARLLGASHLARSKLIASLIALRPNASDAFVCAGHALILLTHSSPMM